jgi:hypothetical protein
MSSQVSSYPSGGMMGADAAGDSGSSTACVVTLDAASGLLQAAK